MKSIHLIAQEVAIKWHGEQYYRDHLVPVAAIIMMTDSYKMRTDKDDILAAAFLHDILADTEYPVEEFIKTFGDKIYI